MQRWIRFARPDGSLGFGTLDGPVGEETIAVHDGDMFSGSTATGETAELSAVQVMTPCTPSKIVALWNNLRAAAAKQGWAEPAEPLYFLKPPSCCIGHGASVVKPRSYSGRVLYEGELGIVIGTTCVDVALDDVDDVVFGYTCVNDVTALELITADASFAQWSRAKSFDTFGALGPVIASGIDPDGLQVQTLVGGKVRQDYPVSDMFFSPRQLVSLISRDMTLNPGDVIACGTSSGAMPMRPGTQIEISIEGIGVLANSLVDPDGAADD
ncbi:MAG: fumarylacetoacetate hydrolase family protein [Actinobacteria bacterium]|nr:fumarylacetoacetate hydrolase family protein [Actinomycetota bacterium]